MLPKYENALNTVTNGVREVILGNAENLLLIINGKSRTKISIEKDLVNN